MMVSQRHFLIQSPTPYPHFAFAFQFYCTSYLVWYLMTILLLDVAKMFGGGTKYFAIWNQMKTFNENGQALREAFQRGEDPITVELSQSASRAGKPKVEGNEG
jgi:hypothetical protein